MEGHETREDLSSGATEEGASAPVHANSIRFQGDGLKLCPRLRMYSILQTSR